jgi:four helix bundle protein
MQREYLSLEKTDVYRLSRELSLIGWKIYQDLSWQEKKIVGNQFIEAVDSVGANVAEGFGRFHFLDKMKFYYNARGSLLEARHWLDLLAERKLIGYEVVQSFLQCYKNLRLVLNGFIEAVRKAKDVS